MEQLYLTASFDWGGVSSVNQLASSWKLDNQHAWSSLSTRSFRRSQLLESKRPNGQAYEQGALQTHLRECREASLTSKSFSSYLRRSFWQDDNPAVASYSDLSFGRIDGSLPSLQSGEGNIPLHLKLRLAQALGSFSP